MTSKRTAQAMIWSAIDVFLRFGLQFLLSVLLSRILTPADFGLMASLLLFTSLAGLFVDSGFTAVLVQQQEITPADESTIFFFNLAMAAVISALLYLASPHISAFFAQPLLQPLMWVMALNIFVGALGSVHNALLTRQLKFKPIMVAGVTSSTVSGGLSLFMALHDWGVWSLAWQTLAATLLNVLLLWSFHDWRPRLIFSRRSLEKLFQSGGFLFVSTLLDILFTRLHTLLIGKLFSVTDLGYYTRALNTRNLPTTFLDSIFIRVAFPSFSSAAGDMTRLVGRMKNMMSAMMLINIPLMLGLTVVAEPFTLVVFGEKWLPSAPILQALGLNALLVPINTVNLNAIKALGHSRLYFQIELAKKTIGILLTLYASLYGVMAIAWVQLLIAVIAFFINSHYTARLFGYGAIRQLRDVSPFMAAGMLMVGGIWSIRKYLGFPPATELLISVVAGALVYGLTTRCIIRSGKSHELLVLLARKPSA